MTWTRYKEIRYAAAGIPDALLTDYPKRFRIVADADIAAELAGGGGIKVTSADGLTDLPFAPYVDTDLAAGTVHLRAKFTLSAVANAGDVIGRLYYSADEATIKDREGLVSNGYELFLPLESGSATPPELIDWTSNNADGTLVNGPAFTFDTDLDLPAVVLDGSNDYVSVPYHAGFAATDVTVSLWITPRVTISGIVAFVDNRDNGGGDTGGWVLESSGGTLLWVLGLPFISVSHTFAVGSPSQLAVTHSGSTARLYVNGAQVAVDNIGAISPFARDVLIGMRNDGFPFDGKISDPSISSVARSAEWIAYDYTDGISNADTFTLGAEEGASGNRRRRLLLARAA